MQITNTIEENQETGDVLVYWTIVDGEWTYMDIYDYTPEQWNITTPEQLQDRQLNQYITWREYCANPATIDLTNIKSITIHSNQKDL
jgi:uncharacterized protein YbdZ (MbtH family)